MTKVTYRCHGCGTDHAIEQIRRNLYLGQRTLGDLQAAARGPVPLAKRLARRRLTRTLMRSLWGN